MYISKVSLVNYRNFKNTFFEFNKGINTIIGENGSGKTNLFRAIRLLLDDNLLRMSYKLNDKDFNRGLDDWRGHWIIISIEFNELTKDESIQSLFIHGVGNGEGEMVEKATYNLFFRPKADIRLALSKLKKGDKAGLDKIRSSISIDNYETLFTGKSDVDFNDLKVYNSIVGDFENVIFNFPDDFKKIGLKVPHVLSVSSEISFTFIKALRDVVSDFHNSGKNPLLTLLRMKSEDINEDDYKKISETVEELNNSIEQLPDVLDVSNSIKSTIKDTVGETYSPSSLSIKSNLSDEASKLLQSLQLFIGEPNETYEGAIHELSLGGANLIFLTLKLLEFKYQKEKETCANFLIIEEPEAHIHTHIQKTLFDRLDYGDTQILYSTHSTQISEVSNLLNINVLAKKVNHALAFQPAKGLNVSMVNKLERYLDAIRTNLLFAKGVILVEGDAEEILIPLLIKKVLGVSVDELGVSIINIRSTGFENIACVFHEERIRRKCSIITDLDTSIIDYNILDDDGDKLKAFKGKCKRSEEKGAERKERLDRFSKDNDWIDVFYAKHTFEVDFLLEHNDHVVCELVPQLYKKKSKRKDVISELESLTPEIAGKRVLIMANNEGKGWFAILLGKYISSATYIPDYIINALIFATPEISESTIIDILEYRIRENTGDKDLTGTKVELEKLKKGTSTIKTVVKIFSKEKQGDDAGLNYLNHF